jgi:hypothetical protein
MLVNIYIYIHTHILHGFTSKYIEYQLGFR